MDNKQFMTPQEYREYKRIKSTPADKIKRGSALAKVVTDMLDAEVDVELDDGTIVNMSLQEKLAISRIKYELDHPEKIDLNAWQKVKGEAKDVIELQNASDLFGDLVIKEDETE